MRAILLSSVSFRLGTPMQFNHRFNGSSWPTQIRYDVEAW